MYDSPAPAYLRVSAFMTAQSGVAAAPSAGAVFSLALRLSPQERRSAQKVAAGAAKRAFIVAVNLLAYHHGCTARAVGFKKP